MGERAVKNWKGNTHTTGGCATLHQLLHEEETTNFGMKKHFFSLVFAHFFPLFFLFYINIFFLPTIAALGGVSADIFLWKIQKKLDFYFEKKHPFLAKKMYPSFFFYFAYIKILMMIMILLFFK